MAAAEGEAAEPARRPKKFYVPEAGGFQPMRLAGSPWRGDALNGVAIGLLMIHTLETEGDTGGGRLARFTMDIMRPALSQLTTVTWRVATAGRRVRRLEGVLESGGVEAVRASALYVSPTGAPPPPMPLASPGHPPEVSPQTPYLGREAGIDLRVLQRGHLSPAGDRVAQSAWVRVEAEVIPGAPPSPIGLAIAASDTGGSTISGAYGQAWTYPNLDIAAHFSRHPEGEWIHVVSEPLILGQGLAVIDHQLSDLRGPFARSHQTLLFTPRQAGAAA